MPSRAERELAELKAKQELAELKAKEQAKRLAEKQERTRAEEARRAGLTPEERAAEDKRNLIIGLVSIGALILFVVIGLLSSSDSSSSPTATTSRTSPSVTSRSTADINRDKCWAAYDRLLDNGTPPVGNRASWTDYCLNGGPNGNWPEALPDPG